jgi:hypothetical protein
MLRLKSQSKRRIGFGPIENRNEGFKSQFDFSELGLQAQLPKPTSPGPVGLI